MLGLVNTLLSSGKIDKNSVENREGLKRIRTGSNLVPFHSNNCRARAIGFCQNPIRDGSQRGVTIVKKFRKYHIATFRNAERLNDFSESPCSHGFNITSCCHTHELCEPFYLLALFITRISWQKWSVLKTSRTVIVLKRKNNLCKVWDDILGC